MALCLGREGQERDWVERAGAYCKCTPVALFLVSVVSVLHAQARKGWISPVEISRVILSGQRCVPTFIGPMASIDGHWSRKETL